jgi:hypothetical protein
MYNNNYQELENLFSIKNTTFDSELCENENENGTIEKQCPLYFGKIKENEFEDIISLNVKNQPKIYFGLIKEKEYKNDSDESKKEKYLSKEQLTQRKLKRNAECAKRARARKKIYYENLLKENNQLKKDLEELQKYNLILTSKLCENCKKELYGQTIIYLNQNNEISIKTKILIYSAIATIIFISLLYNFN